MKPDRTGAIVEFINSAEKLKDTLRSGRTSGSRLESTAEHSWRLALMAMLFTEGMGDVDQLRLLKLCLVHDLGEALSGDIPAPEQTKRTGKREQEMRDMEILCATLPADLRGQVLALWQEYDAEMTKEAKLAKGFDKLETILQHAVGDNPEDFDLSYNLAYGREQTEALFILSEIRQIADEMTRDRMNKQSRPDHEHHRQT